MQNHINQVKNGKYSDGSWEERNMEINCKLIKEWKVGDLTIRKFIHIKTKTSRHF